MFMSVDGMLLGYVMCYVMLANETWLKMPSDIYFSSVFMEYNNYKCVYLQLLAAYYGI